MKPELANLKRIITECGSDCDEGLTCVVCLRKKINDFVIHVNYFMPDREPVMPGEPNRWNDCIDAMEKTLKEFEEGR